MIATSGQYKTKVQEKSQTWLPSATVDFSDFNLDNSITSSVYFPDNTSDGDQIANGREVASRRWWYWDSFQWGDHLRSQFSTREEKGAVSLQRSFNNGEFRQYSSEPSGFSPMAGFTLASLPVSYPTFTLSFSPRAFVSLKTAFEFVLEQWAVDFDYVLTQEDGTTHEYSVTGYTSWRREVQITPVPNVVSITLIVKKWSKPDSQAKVMELYTSIQRQFAGDTLLSFSVQEEAEQSQPTTPIGNISANALTIGFLNLDSEFDNDSDSVLAGSITSNRRVKPFLQIEGSTDVIPLGEFYTKQWNINNNEQTAFAQAVDIIGLMGERTYDKSVFITPGADQDFTYTTTSDFNSFTLVNLDSSADELKPHDSTIYLTDPVPVSFAGFTVASYSSLASFAPSTATAVRTISYTYTPGTTVVASISLDTVVTPDSDIFIYINEQLVNGGPIFIQPTTNDTTQQLDIRIEFVYSSFKPILKDISINVAETVSLASLANKVLVDYDSDTGLLQGRWTIAPEFSQYDVPVAYLPLDTYREALRAIAQAGGGRVYQDRLGFVRIVTDVGATAPARIFNGGNIFDESKPVNPREVFNRIEILINRHFKGASTDVAKVQVSIPDTIAIDYQVKGEGLAFENYTFAGLPSGVTASNVVEYTWGVEFTLTNASGSDETFELTINAEPWAIDGNQRVIIDDADSIRQSGVISLEIDNYLIQSPEYANVLGQRLIGTFGNQRRITNIDITPDPSLIIGDSIDSNNHIYVIESNLIEVDRSSVTHIIKASRS